MTFKFLNSLGLIVFFCFSAPVHAEVDFAHEVVPLLKEKCLECHGGKNSKGGFSMNTRALTLEADVIDGNKPETSILIEVLLSDDEDERMPPPKKQEHPLTKEEVDVFRRWISAGLPWDDGITFAEKRYQPPLKPRAVRLPENIKDGHQAIDYLVNKEFIEHSFTPPKLVNDEAFMRRLYLDVLGVPPNAKDRSLLRKGKLNRPALVDKVLKEDQLYAEHWMVFWNDLLRNEFSGTGFIDGGRRQITGWLYKSLLENKPYDVFVRELISPVKGSSGFIHGIKWRGNVNASQTQDIQFSQNISQVFLGINMKCASCHDSFINEWTLKDAYGLAAITAEKPLEMFRCDKSTGKIAKPKWIFPELGDIDSSLPREKRLEQLAELMTHPKNGRMQRTIVNRIWKQFMGKGIVHPVETLDLEPWSEELLDYLANTLVREKFNLKAVMRIILNSHAYGMEAEMKTSSSKPRTFQGPVSRRLTAEQFLDSVRRTTGAWPKPSGSAFALKAGRYGQLNEVMQAHQIEEWDNRPLRAVFTNRDPLQASIGRPNREQIVTTRPELFTTLEAMNLANGEAFMHILNQGAVSLIKRFKNKEKLVEHVYQTALTRSPNSHEKKLMGDIIGKKMSRNNVADVLWLVFMLPEFNYIY